MVAYASSKAAILAMTVATAKVCSTFLWWALHLLSIYLSTELSLVSMMMHFSRTWHHKASE